MESIQSGLRCIDPSIEECSSLFSTSEGENEWWFSLHLLFLTSYSDWLNTQWSK